MLLVEGHERSSCFGVVLVIFDILLDLFKLLIDLVLLLNFCIEPLLRPT